MINSGRGGMRRGAGRKSPWQNSETQTIRVPVAIKNELLDLGQQLDQGRGVIGGRLRRELEQLLDDWEAQHGGAGEGQPVQQLIAEIRGLLANHPCQGGHGDRHQRQFRHQRGQCGKSGRGVPVMENETSFVEAVD